MKASGTAREFDFTAQDFAVILYDKDLSYREISYRLSHFYREKRDYLAPVYWYDRRQLFLDVFYWLGFQTDKTSIIKEFPAISMDAAASGRRLTRDAYIGDGKVSHLLFKDIFFRLLYMSEYCSVKMSTILKRYGRERKSPKLMARLNACVQYYGLIPYVQGVKQPDLNKVGLDQYISFRLK